MVRVPRPPGHLLVFNEPLADRRLTADSTQPDAIGSPLAIAVSIVHDEAPVVIQINDELFELAKELGARECPRRRDPSPGFPAGATLEGAAVPQVFAALMSYGLAVKVLQEVFPLAVANALIPHGLPDNVYTC